eukprot:10139976-Lingulodinium_polyedra.AAC.1
MGSVLATLWRDCAGSTTSHCKAHVGQPWNACVDSLAKWAALQHSPDYPAARFQTTFATLLATSAQDLDWD